MATTYAPPTIVSPALPQPETFTDVRCPACVSLGWDASRLLFKVYGAMVPSGATLQIRCHRCHSLVAWEIGTPILRAVQLGPKNGKRRKVAFE